MKAQYTRDYKYRAVQFANGKYYLQTILLPIDKSERPTKFEDPWCNLGPAFTSERDVMRELTSRQPIDKSRAA